MDLCELRKTEERRHPWETVRVQALRTILSASRTAWKTGRVLDVGCGDGFTIAALCQDLESVAIDAVDTALTPEQRETFSRVHPPLTFHASLRSLPHNAYQLITLFDVLEHIDDDAHFLTDLVHRFASKQETAQIFITVPAFQALMSHHDRALKHRRRYSPAMVHRLAAESGLAVKVSGSLFWSLLPLRLLSLLGEQCSPARERSFQGVGQWRHGTTLTKCVVALLSLDCWLAIKAQRLGIRIPGLTLWFLCETQRS